MSKFCISNVQYFFSGETHKYGCVAIKNSSEINKFMEHWKPSLVDEAVEMRKESHAATVLSSLFNWLNGQAHCQGFSLQNVH